MLALFPGHAVWYAAEHGGTASRIEGRFDALWQLERSVGDYPIPCDCAVTSLTSGRVSTEGDGSQLLRMQKVVRLNRG